MRDQAGPDEWNKAKRFVALHGKPIALPKEQKAHMEIAIEWRNGSHGDPENVFGSLADALFVNDRNLDGKFSSAISEAKRGKVEVEINI